MIMYVKVVCISHLQDYIGNYLKVQTYSVITTELSMNEYFDPIQTMLHNKMLVLWDVPCATCILVNSLVGNPIEGQMLSFAEI